MGYELKKIKVIGITTDFNECDCCGKKDLKKTVAILDLDTSSTLHFGTSCAYMANKYDTLQAFDEAKKQIRKAEYAFVADVKDARLTAFKLLGKLHGINGTLSTGMKPNCSDEVYGDCVDRILRHMANPETRRTIFKYDTK